MLFPSPSFSDSQLPEYMAYPTATAFSVLKIHTSGPLYTQPEFAILDRLIHNS
jgi:hypothetical protein